MNRTGFATAVLLILALSGAAWPDSSAPPPFPTAEDLQNALGQAAADVRALPPYVVEAFVLSEDKTFRARFAAGKCSNVTTWVVKDLAGPQAMMLDRVALTVWQGDACRNLTQDAGAEDVLAYYLHNIPISDLGIGVWDGARTRFHKEAADLTAREAAELAALTRGIRDADLLRSRVDWLMVQLADSGLVAR